MYVSTTHRLSLKDIMSPLDDNLEIEDFKVCDSRRQSTHMYVGNTHRLSERHHELSAEVHTLQGPPQVVDDLESDGFRVRKSQP